VGEDWVAAVTRDHVGEAAGSRCVVVSTLPFEPSVSHPRDFCRSFSRRPGRWAAALGVDVDVDVDALAVVMALG